MPTDQIDDDLEVSAMLNKAQPPKSPEHLDAAILKYAKAQASVSAYEQEHGMSWLSLAWLQQNWMPAAATLSVAAIAVSVSLQIFTEPALQSASKAGLAEIAPSDAVPARQSTPINIAVDTEEPIRPSVAASSALQNSTPRTLAASDTAIQSAQLRRELEQENLLQTADAGVGANGTEIIEELTEADAAANQLASTFAADSIEDRAETSLASTATARSRSASAQEQAASFLAVLNADAGLQETVIIVLRRSLGVREQASIAVQREFSLQINPLVETYRQLSDPAILLNIQNRYTVARSERLDSRLPESVEDLVSVLESQEN